MKKKIPLIAIIIIAAICFANKDEIKQMFNKGEDAVICESCIDQCPCVDAKCICEDTCKCPKCIA